MFAVGVGELFSPTKPFPGCVEVSAVELVGSTKSAGTVRVVAGVSEVVVLKGWERVLEEDLEVVIGIDDVEVEVVVMLETDELVVVEMGIVVDRVLVVVVVEINVRVVDVDVESPVDVEEVVVVVTPEEVLVVVVARVEVSKTLVPSFPPELDPGGESTSSPPPSCRHTSLDASRL